MKFRFHTGSIKSAMLAGKVFSVLLFRFHTGSIKRMPMRTGRDGATPFRFHTGSIKREAGACERPQFFKVSIPYWFD